MGKEGFYHKPFGETSGSGEAGSAKQIVTDLIQKQQLAVGDTRSYYDKWVVLASEIYRQVPAEVHETIKKVGLGLGFLLYNQWGEMGLEGRGKQVAFQKQLQRERKYFGMNQLVLTHEQGQMLRDIASVVNVTYDPGEPEATPENMKKRTFVFADLEDKPAATTNVVDAER